MSWMLCPVRALDERAVFNGKRQITVLERDSDNEHSVLTQRQVERWLVFGLLWTHISPLQMNINKELLISAACTVREYVCMQGREQALLLCCSSSTQPGLPSHLSSSSFRLLSYSFFGFLPAHSFSLPFLFVTNCYATWKDVANGGSRVVPVNVFFSLFVIYDTHYLIEQGEEYIRF